MVESWLLLRRSLFFWAIRTADEINVIISAARRVTYYFVCATYYGTTKYVLCKAILAQTFVSIKNKKILSSWTGYFCLFLFKRSSLSFWLSHKLLYALFGLCRLKHTDGISISYSVLMRRTDSSNLSSLDYL